MSADLYNLRVSNRGNSATETVTNQAWSVRLPEKLTLGSRPCRIRVVSGTIQLLTDPAVFHSYSEVSIRSNISLNGFDVESNAEDNDGNALPNSSNNLQNLFSVDLNTFVADNLLQPFKLDNPRTFYCGALPNQLEFGRFGTLAATTVPLAGDWFISFDLEIEFTSCQCDK